MVVYELFFSSFPIGNRYSSLVCLLSGLRQNNLVDEESASIVFYESDVSRPQLDEESEAFDNLDLNEIIAISRDFCESKNILIVLSLPHDKEEVPVATGLTKKHCEGPVYALQVYIGSFCIGDSYDETKTIMLREGVAFSLSGDGTIEDDLDFVKRIMGCEWYAKVSEVFENAYGGPWGYKGFCYG